MKRSKGIATALTAGLLVSACATQPPSRPALPFEPGNARVVLLDGQNIAVDQEPIYITSRDMTVVWNLPPDQKLAFARNGITVRDGAKDFDCRPGREATQFTCKFVGSAKRGTVYKYAIHITRDGKELPPLDPSMVPNF